MNLDFTFNFGDRISEFKDNIAYSKKYWIIYLIFLFIGSLSMISADTFTNPNMEIFALVFISIVGIFCVSYAISKYSEENLYKIAFILILVFGIICVFVMPICITSDTPEHLTRAEITSRGIMFPEYIGSSYSNYYYNGTDYIWNGGGFETISSSTDFSDYRYGTIFTVPFDDEKVNNTLIVVDQAFEQNPFFGYLPQAFGIFIAKILDLNVIWMLWLGGIANLICYAGIVSYAVKKTPIFKVPIIVAACMPMSMFQAASVSSDSMFIALTILLISYFFYLCKSDIRSISNKEICIFILLSLIIGLLKLPYLACSLLLFAIPSENFKSKNYAFYSVLGILIMGIIGLLYSRFATDALWHSARSIHYLQYNVNSTQQLSFLLSNGSNPIILGSEILNSLKMVLSDVFIIYPPSGSLGYSSASDFISAVFPLFLGCVFLAYPNENKFEFKNRFFALLILILIYFGICFVQFLTWTPGGKLWASGISPRYFLGLFPLIPFIFNFNIADKKSVEFDGYVLTLTISFMAIMVIAFIFGFY